MEDEGPGFDPATVPVPSDPTNLERIGGRARIGGPDQVDVQGLRAGDAVLVIDTTREQERNQSDGSHSNTGRMRPSCGSAISSRHAISPY